MLVKETAWNEVVSRLNSLRSSQGIKKVYPYFVDLDSISLASFPFIMIEPDVADEDEDVIDNEGGSYCLEDFRVTILIGFAMFEKGKAVTGSDDIPKGIFDYEYLVKTKLTEDPKHLGGRIVRIHFPKTLYLRSVEEVPKKGIIRLIQIDTSLKIKFST